jgi:pyruvyltransferase
VSSRSINAYWWARIPNFGDLLTPLLLKHFSRLDAVRAPIREADIVVVGSIIEHIPADWPGMILGAGKLHERTVPRLDQANILALRGPLSAKGVKGEFALGDCGLLAHELVDIKIKKHALGIVPHWSDTELALNPTFRNQDGTATVIDPRGDPLGVIRTIGECHKIVASSLHGVILADAFGIPRRIEETSRFVREGGMFKFRDYSESIHTPFVTGRTTLANTQAVDDRKSELYDALRALDTWAAS